METPAARVERLVSALEDLLAQEATALRHGDYYAAGMLVDRAGPLFTEIAASAAVITDPALRMRIRRLQATRAENQQLLLEAMNLARVELNEANAARRCVAQVAPAYTVAQVNQPTRGQLRAVS